MYIGIVTPTCVSTVPQHSSIVIQIGIVLRITVVFLYRCGIIAVQDSVV